MNPRPDAFETEPPVIVVDRAPRQELMGQQTSRAPRTVEVEDAVDDVPHVHLMRSTARLGRGNARFYELPLLIRQIAWIWCPFHILIIGPRVSKRPLFTHALRESHGNDLVPGNRQLAAEEVNYDRTGFVLFGVWEQGITVYRTQARTR